MPDMNPLMLEFAANMVINYTVAAAKLQEALGKANITIQSASLPADLQKVVDTVAGFKPPTGSMAIQASHTQKGVLWTKKTTCGQIHVHALFSAQQGNCSKVNGSAELQPFLNEAGILDQWIFWGEFQKPAAVRTIDMARFQAEHAPPPPPPAPAARAFPWGWVGGAVLLLVVIAFFLLSR